MVNETLFLVTVCANILFVFLAARIGYHWLLGTIGANMILIGIFGGGLIELFGITTNIGNIFYACIFFATHLIIEHYGRRKALETIWFGASIMLFFTIISQLAIRFEGSSLTTNINTTITELFSQSPRIFTASILAYIFAQYINIMLYEKILLYTGRKLLWLRSNSANVVSQLADSAFFFTIAFIDLPGHILIQTIVAGWLLKVVVVFCGTPLLYLDNYLLLKLRK